jgi:hypothetical protein
MFSKMHMLCWLKRKQINIIFSWIMRTWTFNIKKMKWLIDLRLRMWGECIEWQISNWYTNLKIQFFKICRISTNWVECKNISSIYKSKWYKSLMPNIALIESGRYSYEIIEKLKNCIQLHSSITIMMIN